VTNHIVEKIYLKTMGIFEDGEPEFHLAVGEGIPFLAIRAHLEIFESVPLSDEVSDCEDNS
jgi:hypothetical protein